MNKKLLEILACPICKHHPLEEYVIDEKDGLVYEGAIFCTECSRFYPIIEEILGSTFGHITFQEQFMLLAQKLAGFTPA